MGNLRGRLEWVERDPMKWSPGASGPRIMADDGGQNGGPSRPKPKAVERPFDMWLQKQLHAMYDEIASEPLPDELVKLIEKDAAKVPEKK